jgi:hypothetical protein
MKRILLATLSLAGLLAAGAAQAHANVNWSVSISGGLPGVVVAPAPVYVEPAPVYVPPPPVYVPAPVVYRPAPVYVAPRAVVVEPAPVYVPYGRWHRHHHHHDWD